MTKKKEQAQHRQMTSIEAVIFDLGRVLVDVDLTQGIFRYLKQAAPDEDRRLMEHLFAQEYFRKYIRGQMTPQEFFSHFKQYLNAPLDFEQFKKEWCRVFKPMPGIEELVRTLSQSYRLGLLSDIGPLHWAHLKEMLGVIKFFPRPLLSFETGCIKPQPECFRMAAQSVDCPPKKCLFIDDREINVQGAKAFGMQAVQFTNTENLRRELQSLGVL